VRGVVGLEGRGGQGQGTAGQMGRRLAGEALADHRAPPLPVAASLFEGTTTTTAAASATAAAAAAAAATAGTAAATAAGRAAGGGGGWGWVREARGGTPAFLKLRLPLVDNPARMQLVQLPGPAPLPPSPLIPPPRSRDGGPEEGEAPADGRGRRGSESESAEEGEV
jgi:hypothetical protein